MQQPGKVLQMRNKQSKMSLKIGHAIPGVGFLIIRILVIGLLVLRTRLLTPVLWFLVLFLLEIILEEKLKPWQNS